MKKRILSLLLAVVLCLSLLPTAALAEEGTGVVAEVTIDGEVRSYATLQEAFDAVGSSIDSVIKLLADITLENGLTIRGGVFTLDLNGKTVNHSDADVNAVSMTGGIVTLTDHGTGSGTIGQKFVVNGGTLNMSGGKIAGSLVLGNPAGQISLSGGSFDSIRIDTPAEEKRESGRSGRNRRRRGSRPAEDRAPEKNPPKAQKQPPKQSEKQADKPRPPRRRGGQKPEGAAPQAAKPQPPKQAAGGEAKKPRHRSGRRHPRRGPGGSGKTEA